MLSKPRTGGRAKYYYSSQYKCEALGTSTPRVLLHILGMEWNGIFCSRGVTSLVLESKQKLNDCTQMAKVSVPVADLWGPIGQRTNHKSIPAELFDCGSVSGHKRPHT
ncbi:hypothetical protein BHM03_00051834 [Ensete ventricosum]|nr:hypothetical protein BHM03_00051834 [Ensete ventricosum]